MMLEESRSKMVNRLTMRRDGDDGEERKRGNTKIAFGLCKKYGIKLPEGAGPKEAWEALDKIGVTETDAMEYLEKYKTIKGYKPRKNKPEQSIGKAENASQNARTEPRTAPESFGTPGIIKKGKFNTPWDAFKGIKSEIGCSVDNGLSKIMNTDQATQMFDVLYTMKKNYGVVPSAVKRSNKDGGLAMWEDGTLNIISLEDDGADEYMRQSCEEQIKDDEEAAKEFDRKYKDTEDEHFKELAELARGHIKRNRDRLSWKSSSVNTRYPNQTATCIITHECSHGLMDEKSQDSLCLEKIQLMERRKFRHSGKYETVEEADKAADEYFRKTNYTSEMTGLDHDISYKAVQGTDGEKLFDICRKARSKARENGDIKNISRYADYDTGEFFAECFTAYMMKEKLPDYIVDMIMAYK